MSPSHYEYYLCSLFIFSVWEVAVWFGNLQQIACAFPKQTVLFPVKVANSVNSRDFLELSWMHIPSQKVTPTHSILNVQELFLFLIL